MSDASQARRSEDLGRGSALASVLEEVVERRIVLGDLEQVQQLVAVQPPVAPLVPGSPDTRRNAPTRELLAAAHSPQFEWKQPRGEARDSRRGYPKWVPSKAACIQGYKRWNARSIMSRALALRLCPAALRPAPRPRFDAHGAGACGATAVRHRTHPWQAPWRA